MAPKSKVMKTLKSPFERCFGRGALVRCLNYSVEPKPSSSFSSATEIRMKGINSRRNYFSGWLNLLGKPNQVLKLDFSAPRSLRREKLAQMKHSESVPRISLKTFGSAAKRRVTSAEFFTEVFGKNAQTDQETREISMSAAFG